MTGRKSASEAQNIWLDSRSRFGLVSRLLHWGIAYLLIWQFSLILAWRTFPNAEILKLVSRFGPYHGTVGILTIVLVIFRAIWALANLHRRPSYTGGIAGIGARFGHIALYLLMFVTPAAALLRSYGRGDGWRLWNIPIIPSTGEPISWMIVLGDATHSVLAWALFVLIAGHVVMALSHGLLFKDGILNRMMGSLGRRATVPPEKCRQIVEKENIACHLKSHHPSA